ncbi:hypothetical protein FQA39_LY03367 [Lamprigera yunnana]|nr:hypothetical protein FQA39_LY03367 [Lamprigera yunnana]
MAIFEQETTKKVLLDDTENVSCVIENWRTTNGHTEYIIRVHRGPISQTTWRIYKRYNDFVALHSYLQTSGIPLLLPPKKIIGNREPEFISERQQGLQKYLNSILMNPILVSSLPAKSFVDPANYCQPFSELALQHVSLALRGEVGWEVVGPLSDIGWRLRKHFYQVRCKALPKEDLIASWTDYGPDKYLNDKDIHIVFKSICQIQHPYIHSIELCLGTDVGGLVVRNSNINGSVRDTICGAKPRLSFLKKYGNPKGHKPLSSSQVALYGRQILEALKFLKEKGLHYGHLHTGNIIVESDRVKLLDIENGILGVPSFYRPYFMQHKRICSLEAIDIYCLGHTLYEMTFGAPLQESTIDCLPSECAPNLRSVLESILSSESCKNGLPTIDGLLQHPFFASIALSVQPNEKAQLKIPTATKERLKVAQTHLEERLKEEQKLVRSQKRLVRVQELMSSEEEKKKQRHKKKQEQRVKEQQQQLKEKHNEIKEGVNGEAGDSGTSTSTTTSVGTVTPPSISGSSRIPSPPPPPTAPPLASSLLKNGDTSSNSKDRCKLWLSACAKEDLYGKDADVLYNSYRVCSRHFNKPMFLNDLQNRLQPHAVPSESLQQQKILIEIEDPENLYENVYIVQDKHSPSASTVSGVSLIQEEVDPLAGSPTVPDSEIRDEITPLKSSVQTQTSQNLYSKSPQILKLRTKLRSTQKQVWILRKKLKKYEELCTCQMPDS